MLDIFHLWEKDNARDKTLVFMKTSYARFYRPNFRENKPKKLFFND